MVAVEGFVVVVVDVDELQAASPIANTTAVTGSTRLALRTFHFGPEGVALTGVGLLSIVSWDHLFIAGHQWLVGLVADQAGRNPTE